ncbi:unnamed protein product [Diatraea saccharalis]|uniref:Integrin alpha-2 domain-containing protein n=1 Tax=Diatraea saccharalis TaxID=40085 RepID=A0A9P0G1J4_9NEOP|nr:unnamed protein product [Diatraea saccharalis]
MLKAPADKSRGGALSRGKYVKITDDVVGSMFGAAMGSADLNNDGLSELLVGAPAQDDLERGSETGALHIYLGGDVRTVNEDIRHRIIVSSEDRSRFGSAIATSDVDGDNFPEIFVSAPYEGNGIGAVYILSGFEINEMVISKHKHKHTPLATLKRTQKISREEFKTFGYSLQNIPDKNNNGCDDLKATNEVIGNGAQIEASQMNIQWTVSGNKLEEIRCKEVLVKLTIETSLHCLILLHNTVTDLWLTEFNTRWAMISSQSSLESSLEVSRHCTGKDCDPDLIVDISWPLSEDFYQLDSSDSLSPLLKVRNRGNSSFEACVLVRVSGAPVLQIDCGDYIDGYKCHMPKPLKRNAGYEIPITFNMSQPSTQQKELRIQASVFDFCNQANATSKEFEWIMPYKVDIDQILVKRLSFISLLCLLSVVITF